MRKVSGHGSVAIYSYRLPVFARCWSRALRDEITAISERTKNPLRTMRNTRTKISKANSIMKQNTNKRGEIKMGRYGRYRMNDIIIKHPVSSIAYYSNDSHPLMIEVPLHRFSHPIFKRHFLFVTQFRLCFGDVAAPVVLN